ncbi:unnamed protein product [Auanema sp. JU1783]|nr:unnamed protein product [Auanema sp. JU1783]
MSQPASILQPTLDAYQKALNSGVHEEALSFYHPEAVVVHRGKQATYGRDNLLALFATFGEMMGKNHSTISDAVFEGSENYITITAKYTTETEKLGTVKGNYSQVWKKEDGKWLVIYDIYDDNL